MNFINKRSIYLLLITIHLLLLFSYLTLNIENVGEMGVALPLLAGFVLLSCAAFAAQLINSALTIRLSLFLFLLLVLWVSFRVVIDLGSLDYLKQITIATTGGMLLFYLIGTFSRQILNSLTESSKSNFYPKLLLIAFTLLCLFIFISFKARLMRSDIFFISGVDGGYQRPGNFLIILFIMASFIYLSIAASFITKNIVRLMTWFGVYSAGLALALISSQMVGSNAATANIIAIYMMTCVISLLAVSSKIRRKFLQGHLYLPLSKVMLKNLIKYSGITLISLGLLAVITIQITGFDLNKTRAFGFGSGANSSVTSRFDILLETGSGQLSYAPFFGNVNVAELTTGDAGRTLHNFLPNVMAELGLVGLVIVLSLLLLTFRTLLKTIRSTTKNPQGFKISIINFWLFFMLAFMFLYSNISVGKSWPVMWFFIGFSVNVFVFNKKNNYKLTSRVSS